jgi:cysteine desulfurase
MMPNLVYLDYAASTPIDDRVVAAMAPHHGAANPSSSHVVGRAAAELVEAARAHLARLLGGRPHEIVFTSGATEADNLAIDGALRAAGGGHVVTGATEHKAVLETVLAHCPNATVLPVDELGQVDPSAVLKALRPDTVLVSIMAANNEVGSLARLADIGAICRSRDVLFHSDAAQAVAKVPLDVSSLAIDLLSVSGHKMYGPKGVGALWVRRHAQDRIKPVMHGGGHERGLRSGTVNVAGCVGFGEAARLACQEAEREEIATRQLRAHLEAAIREAFPDAEFNGDPNDTVPGIVNVRLPGIEAESLLLATPSVAASTGSACTSATPAPSHVLRAMGRSHEAAQECVRLSFGRFTTPAQIDQAIEVLAASAALLREEPAGVTS